MTRESVTWERMARARNHLARAHRNGQTLDQTLGEALADLRWFALEEGASFGRAIDHSRARCIHDRINTQTEEHTHAA